MFTRKARAGVVHDIHIGTRPIPGAVVWFGRMVKRNRGLEEA